MRLAFLTTAEGAVASVGPVAAGFLVAFAGFGPLFALVIIALAVALSIMVFGVREPRTAETHDAD